MPGYTPDELVELLTPYFATRVAESAPLRATMWHDEAIVLAGSALARRHDTDQNYNTNSDQVAHADNESFSNGCFLKAGTYTFRVMGYRSSDHGKIDWTIDGVSIVAGQDWYNAVASYNYVFSTAAVAVLTTGWHTIVGTVNGKNGASADFQMSLTKYWFEPAAD